MEMTSKEDYRKNWLNTPPLELVGLSVAFPLVLLLINLGIGLANISKPNDTGRPDNPVILICARPRRGKRQCKEIELEAGEQLVVQER
jgi:hypothetical protein